MSKEKDKIETLFSNLKDSSWDTEEPTIGHRERFMAKLGKQEGTGNQSKTKSSRRLWLTVATPIAAAIVLFLGIFLTYSPKDTIENDITTNIEDENTISLDEDEDDELEFELSISEDEDEN